MKFTGNLNNGPRKSLSHFGDFLDITTAYILYLLFLVIIMVVILEHIVDGVKF